MAYEEEFKDITLEDVIGKSTIRPEQYQDMLLSIDLIMTNLNGYPRDLNKDVWDNKPYDARFEYLDLQHEDFTKLNTTKSLLKNILFILHKDADRLDSYAETIAYYFNLTEEDAKEDIKNNETKHLGSENYKYALKLIHYKENNMGVPSKDG